MPTVEDLGKLVKEKYPTDAYKAMSDADLGRAVKTKYPGTAYDKFEDTPSSEAPPTTPTGLSSIASPSTPPEKPLSEQSGTLKGVGQHIVGGAVSAVPEIGLQIGKAALSIPAVLEKISAGKTSDSTQAGIDWIEGKQKQIAQYFEGTYTAPDMNFSLGPLGKMGVGSTIGGIIPFAAAGSISAMSKAAKAVDVAVPVYEAMLKAMGHGAAFSTAYEIPNVIAAKTWKEAEQRAKDAGVSITVSALMAGAFTGTAKGFGWAKEKMGRTPAEQMAKAQVIAEEGGVPNTEQLGANQPAVTAVDEVHQKIFDQKVKDKTSRLENNIPKAETVDDKVRDAAQRLRLEELKKRAAESGDTETLKKLEELEQRLPSPRQERVDRSGKGDPTAPPDGPVDQVGPMDRALQAVVDMRQDFEKMKGLAHEEVTAAELDPTLGKLTKQKVVALKKLGEEILTGTQGFLEDIHRSVNPISMLARDAQQAFVDFSGKRAVFSMAMNDTVKKIQTEILTNKLDREFVTLLRDSPGHSEVLQIPRSPLIDASLSAVDKFYDTMFKIGVDADIFSPEQGIKNFVNRIYSASDAKKISAIMEAQPLDAKNKHSFRRVYETLEQAAREKHIFPATLDITELMKDYGHSLMNTMANGQLVKDMIDKMPHDLMWTAEKPTDARWRPIDERISTASKETKLPDGKIQVERLYADQNLHKLLSAALDPNPLKGTRLGQIADLNTRFKSAMLMLDVYHLANLRYQQGALNMMALGERALGKESAIISYKEGLKMFDPENPKFESLKMVVKNGLGTDRADWQRLQSISVADVKRAKADFVGKLWDNNFGLKPFNEYMWEKLHKGLKAATAVAEFERLLKDPENVKRVGLGEITHDELARKAATFANNVYGGQSWSTHGRTAKFNAISRMILLAPDWFETRMNLAAGLGKIRENGQFKATAEFKMAARYWTGYMAEMSLAAFMANTLLEKAHPELKNHPMKDGWKGFTNIVLPNKDGSGHNLVLGLGGSYRYVFDALHNLGQTLTNRESALFRAGAEFYTQRDWAGNMTGPSMLSHQNLLHLGANLVPVPLTLRLLDIEFNAAGVANTKTGIDVMKSALRSLGTHPTTGYPMELRKKANFLEDRKAVIFHKMLVLSQSGKQAMAAREARAFNEDVVKLINESKKVYRGNEIAKRLEKLLIK